MTRACLFGGQNSDYTTGQVFDLSEKLEQSEAQLGRGSFMLGLDTHDRKSEDKLAKATRDRYVFIKKIKKGISPCPLCILSKMSPFFVLQLQDNHRSHSRPDVSSH